jgi:hypothetical protein
MPQTPLGLNLVDPTGRYTPGAADASDAQLTCRSRTLLSNVTAQAVVKTGVGRISTVIVNTAGSTAGTVSNVATTAGVAAANLIYNIPNTVGIYALDMPFVAGLVITPGTGQVLTISYV